MAAPRRNRFTYLKLNPSVRTVPLFLTTLPTRAETRLAYHFNLRISGRHDGTREAKRRFT